MLDSKHVTNNNCKERETQSILPTNHQMEPPIAYRSPATDFSHELQEAQRIILEDKVVIEQLRKQNEQLKATLRDHGATARSITLLGNLLQKENK